MPHQSTRTADRRRADRERKAKSRAATKAAGVPHPALVDAAIVEGVVFARAKAPAELQDRERRWRPVSLDWIMHVAIEVLVVRHGSDRQESMLAVGYKLRSRPEHMDPLYVPSLNPDPSGRTYATRDDHADTSDP